MRLFAVEIIDEDTIMVSCDITIPMKKLQYVKNKLGKQVSYKKLTDTNVYG